MPDTRPRPNLFIVGAPKCGTSSLHDYLDQHPDVFMSRTMKEPDFFCTDLTINESRRKRTLDDYLSLFSEAAGKKRIGESSVWYLVSTDAAKNIHAYDPAAKIVIMVRNPVDAAYSLHGQFIWSCNEDILDFERALDAEEDRRAGRRIPDTATSPDGLQYTRVFSFHEQIERYYDTFPRGQVKVIVFEDFTKDTPGVYRETLEFLGLAPFEASFEVMNAAKPVSLGLNRFFAKRPKLRNAVHKLVPAGVQRRIVDALPFITKTVKRPSKLDPAVRKRLASRWREDVERLSALLDRDLTHWTAG
jgi:hypothetical protein